MWLRQTCLTHALENFSNADEEGNGAGSLKISDNLFLFPNKFKLENNPNIMQKGLLTLQC